MVHSGGKHQIAICQATPFAQQHLIACKIDALRPNIAVFGCGLLDCNGIASPRCELLNNHCVAACRHDAASENARRLAWPDLSGKGTPRCNFTYNFKSDGRRCHVSRPHGVAVHGRDCGRRLGAQCD